MEGVCIYPIIDRPDWEDPNHWHNSGLWDLRVNGADRLERVLCEPYADELRLAQIATSVRFPRLRAAPRSRTPASSPTRPRPNSSTYL